MTASSALGATATRVRRFGLGRRGPWTGLAAGLLVLGALEAFVLHAVAAAVLPDAAALVVDVVVGGSTLAVVVVLASPLWSRHRLRGGVAGLRLGGVGGVDVPLDAVASARVHVPGATSPPELGAGHDAATGRLSLVRAPSSPCVVVELSRPLPARVQVLRRVETSSVLVGTDDAEALVAALDPAPRDRTGRDAGAGAGR